MLVKISSIEVGLQLHQIETQAPVRSPKLNNIWMGDHLGISAAVNLDVRVV